MSELSDFAKKELNLFRENHRAFSFRDLDQAYARAKTLGYLDAELLNDADAFSAWCEFLKSTASYDAGFGQGVVTQILTQALSGQAKIIAYPAYVNPFSVSSLKLGGIHPNFILNGKIDGLLFGPVADAMIFPIEGKFYLGRMVPKSTAVETLGLRTCPVSSCELKAVSATEIPFDAKKIETIFSKIFVAAAFVLLGLCESSIEEAVQYAKERVQGGRKILAWSEHRMQLADWSLKIKTANLLMGATSLEDAWASLIHLQELASEVTSFGIQALGGSGYMKDYLQEKRFRDANQLRSWFGGISSGKLHLFERNHSL